MIDQIVLLYLYMAKIINKLRIILEKTCVYLYYLDAMIFATLGEEASRGIVENVHHIWGALYVVGSLKQQVQAEGGIQQQGQQRMAQAEGDIQQQRTVPSENPPRASELTGHGERSCSCGLQYLVLSHPGQEVSCIINFMKVNTSLFEIQYTQQLVQSIITILKHN